MNEIAILIVLALFSCQTPAKAPTEPTPISQQLPNSSPPSPASSTAKTAFNPPSKAWKNTFCQQTADGRNCTT
jgi:hypothetical protein